MKRTRKWAYVAQEAKRLADLGLSPPDIGKRLGVRRETVVRWMASGQVTDTRRGYVNRESGRRASGVPIMAIVKPSEWAARVRRDFALDATDEQLVTLAEDALGKALNPMLPVGAQLAAAGRFQSIVKQLNLVSRAADEKPEDEKPKPKTVPVPTRTGTDPRGILSLK